MAQRKESLWLRPKRKKFGERNDEGRAFDEEGAQSRRREVRLLNGCSRAPLIVQINVTDFVRDHVAEIAELRAAIDSANAIGDEVHSTR